MLNASYCSNACCQRSMVVTLCSQGGNRRAYAASSPHKDHHQLLQAAAPMRWWRLMRPANVVDSVRRARGTDRGGNSEIWLGFPRIDRCIDDDGFAEWKKARSRLWRGEKDVRSFTAVFTFRFSCFLLWSSTYQPTNGSMLFRYEKRTHMRYGRAVGFRIR